MTLPAIPDSALAAELVREAASPLHMAPETVLITCGVEFDALGDFVEVIKNSVRPE